MPARRNAARAGCLGQGWSPGATMLWSPARRHAGTPDRQTRQVATAGRRLRRADRADDRCLCVRPGPPPPLGGNEGVAFDADHMTASPPSGPAEALVPRPVLVTGGLILDARERRG